MFKKANWVVVIIISLLVGIYPLAYLFGDDNFGLLATKSSELVAKAYWSFFFKLHIYFSGIALITALPQFSKKIRTQYPAMHKRFGILYCWSVFFGSIGGIVIGFSANGGIIAAIGFILLGVLWLISTFFGYQFAKIGWTVMHRKLMLYSFAFCFSGVTLRIELPLLALLLKNDLIAYQSVAWLCWAPNGLFVYYMNGKKVEYN